MLGVTDQIRAMLPKDWEAVKSIYEAGIASGYATFETQTPAWEKWDADHLKVGRWVAEVPSSNILGWVALSPVSGRCVYGGVAEVSVYVAPDAKGKGIGKALLMKVIEDSEAHGFWTLQSGIFPQNIASQKLHERCGFRFIGYREKVGKRDGVWMDNHLYERRSKLVGI